VFYASREKKEIIMISKIQSYTGFTSLSARPSDGTKDALRLIVKGRGVSKAFEDSFTRMNEALGYKNARLFAAYHKEGENCWPEHVSLMISDASNHPLVMQTIYISDTPKEKGQKLNELASELCDKCKTPAFVGKKLDIVDKFFPD